MKAKPSVRPARRADVPAIAGIARARPESAGWTAAQLEDETGRAASIFLVCELEGAVAGYAIARVAPGEAQLVDVAVSAAREGQGAGRALLAALFASAAALELGRVTLEVSARNARAHNFYIAAGFRVVGRRPKFYNDGADAVLMDRVLP